MNSSTVLSDATKAWRASSAANCGRTSWELVGDPSVDIEVPARGTTLGQGCSKQRRCVLDLSTANDPVGLAQRHQPTVGEVLLREARHGLQSGGDGNFPSIGPVAKPTNEAGCGLQARAVGSCRIGRGEALDPCVHGGGVHVGNRAQGVCQSCRTPVTPPPTIVRSSIQTVAPINTTDEARVA